MVIGANLPDVDALVYLSGNGTTALALRRGWTHGVLAMVVLPILLATIMTVGRTRDRRSARARATGYRSSRRSCYSSPAISIWTHPLFDLLNTYGVRLLMPFSSRWFYGDTLFIVDPWVWLGARRRVRSSRSVARARVPVGARHRHACMARARAAGAHRGRRGRRYIVVMAAIRLDRTSDRRATGDRSRLAAVAARDGGARAAHAVLAQCRPRHGDVVRDRAPHLVAAAAIRRSSANPIPRTANAAIAAALATRDGRHVRVVGAVPVRRDRSTTNDSIVVVHLDDARYATPGTRSFAAVSVTVRRARRGRGRRVRRATCGGT